MYHQGFLSDEIFKADQAFGKLVAKDHPYVMRGYLYLADPVVALMKKSETFTQFVGWVVKPWADEMAYQMGAIHRGSTVGKILMYVGFVVGWVTGFWLSLSIKTRILILICFTLYIFRFKVKIIFSIMYSRLTKINRLRKI